MTDTGAQSRVTELQPFPEPRKIFEDLAQTHIRGTFRRKLFLGLLSCSGVLRYCEQSRRRLMQAAAEGINPFDRDTVSRNFAGLYPELSFCALLEDGDKDPFVRAAKLVRATLDYRAHQLSGSAETCEGRPSTERRESHLFARAVRLFKAHRGWHKKLADYPDSDYIVVACAGRFYRLQVYEAGAAAAPERISSALSTLAQQARQNPGDAAYGALTAVVNKQTLALVHSPSPKAPSVAVIDAALFVLALDLDSAPDDLNTMGQQIHLSGYANRDYRKSFQLVVLANGKAGALFNLFSGIEGVTAAHFMSDIAQSAATLPCDSQASARALAFEALELPGDVAAATQAKARIHKAVCSAPVLHRIDTIGKERIKSLGVSPDAFFHAAVHLAYQKRFGRSPEAHNFIDLRMLKYGSISRYLSTSDAMRTFLASRKRADLLQACAAHKEAILRVRSGEHPLHYIYHYLLATASLRAAFVAALLIFFIPKFTSRWVSPDLWLSNIPAVPGLQCACRLGITLSFLRKQAYTGHYLLFPDFIRVCFLSRDEDGVRNWHVKEELEQACATLEAMLRSPQ